MVEGEGLFEKRQAYVRGQRFYWTLMEDGAGTMYLVASRDKDGLDLAPIPALDELLLLVEVREDLIGSEVDIDAVRIPQDDAHHQEIVDLGPAQVVGGF